MKLELDISVPEQHEYPCVNTYSIDLNRHNYELNKLCEELSAQKTKGKQRSKEFDVKHNERDKNDKKRRHRRKLRKTGEKSHNEEACPDANSRNEDRKIKEYPFKGIISIKIL